MVTNVLLEWQLVIVKNTHQVNLLEDYINFWHFDIMLLSYCCLGHYTLQDNKGLIFYTWQRVICYAVTTYDRFMTAYYRDILQAVKCPWSTSHEGSMVYKPWSIHGLQTIKYPWFTGNKVSMVYKPSSIHGLQAIKYPWPTSCEVSMVYKPWSIHGLQAINYPCSTSHKVSMVYRPWCIHCL